MVKFLFMGMSLLACGSAMDGILDAQSRAQAQDIVESLEKGKSVTGVGAESAHRAMSQLAADLKVGAKVMKDVDKLIASYDAAVADGEISQKEAAIVSTQINNLSKHFTFTYLVN